MSKFQTGFTSGSSGVNYADEIVGEEDDVFHKDATVTQWKQSWEKYAPHRTAMIVQNFSNSGLGNQMTSEMVKNTDFIYHSYVLQYYPGIKPNTAAGITECSWVNCAGLYAIKEYRLTIGSQGVFVIDGFMMLLYAELTGRLWDYASMIGLYKTRSELVRQSKSSRILTVPLLGLPFQNQPNTAFPLGGIIFHAVKSVLIARPLHEMIVNYSSVDTTNEIGRYALPLSKDTNQMVQNTEVQFGLGVNYVWVTKQERVQLLKTYREVIFRELVKGGEFQVPPSTTQQKLTHTLEVKGPVVFAAIEIRSQDDLKQGNWTKLCHDNGDDYVKELMLVTGSVCVEDGLPAPFYRTGKVVEVFKRSIDRQIYIFSFETDAASSQMTGHRNLTNAEKVTLTCVYGPHSMPLETTVTFCVYNAWFTERGTGGKIWSSQ